MSIWDELDHFSPEEFDYPEEMDEDFLRALDRVRDRAAVSIYVTSDYRPGDGKAHGQGVAVDITDDLESDGVLSRWRYKVLLAAFQMGFTRIGIYDKHVHLDTWDDAPQEVAWQGSSQ